MFKRLFLLLPLFVLLISPIVTAEDDGVITSIHIYPGKSDAFIIIEWDLALYSTCPDIQSIPAEERPFHCRLDPVVFRYYVFYFDGRGIFYVPQLSNTDFNVAFNYSNSSWKAVYLFGEITPKLPKANETNYYVIYPKEKCVRPLGNLSYIFTPHHGIPGKIEGNKLVFSNGTRIYTIPLNDLKNHTLLESDLDNLEAVFLENGILFYAPFYGGTKDYGHPYVVLFGKGTYSQDNVKIAKTNDLNPVVLFFYDGKELKTFPLYRITYNNSEFKPYILFNRTLNFSLCGANNEIGRSSISRTGTVNATYGMELWDSLVYTSVLPGEKTLEVILDISEYTVGEGMCPFSNFTELLNCVEAHDKGLIKYSFEMNSSPITFQTLSMREIKNGSLVFSSREYSISVPLKDVEPYFSGLNFSESFSVNSTSIFSYLKAIPYEDGVLMYFPVYGLFSYGPYFIPDRIRWDEVKHTRMASYVAVEGTTYFPSKDLGKVKLPNLPPIVFYYTKGTVKPLIYPHLKLEKRMNYGKEYYHVIPYLPFPGNLTSPSSTLIETVTVTVTKTIMETEGHTKTVTVTETKREKGICGPAFIIMLSLIILTLRREMK